MSQRKKIAAQLREEASILDAETTRQAWAPWDDSQATEADRIIGMCRAAADLLDPPEDDSTVEVRIHARVDVVADGWEYHAAGWGGHFGHDPSAMQCLEGESPDPMYSVITARVPKPVRSEVEGTVDS